MLFMANRELEVADEIAAVLANIITEIYSVSYMEIKKLKGIKNESQ